MFLGAPVAAVIKLLVTDFVNYRLEQKLQEDK